MGNCPHRDNGEAEASNPGLCLTHFLVLVYAAYRIVAGTPRGQERVVQGIALTTGIFAYFAARALGVSLPSLIVQSVEAGKWFSLLLVGAVIPSLTGFFLIRYLMKCMRKDDAVATRVMLLVSALVLVMFADVYAVAAGTAKLEDMRPLLPNITFLLTMMCYIVFEYRPRVTDGE
jgi:hypothetical protein